MSEWKSLCEKMNNILVDMSDIGFAVEFCREWVKLKEEGDKLEEENATLKEFVNKIFNQLADEQQKLEAIKQIAFDEDYVDDPYVGEARAVEEIRKILEDNT